jgi:DnaJ-class molecular chaperone
MQYFTDCYSVEEIKKHYRFLCFKYHPDVSKQDTTAIMQEINEQYLEALESCNGATFTDVHGKEHTYWYLV